MDMFVCAYFCLPSDIFGGAEGVGDRGVHASAGRRGRDDVIFVRVSTEVVIVVVCVNLQLVFAGHRQRHRCRSRESQPAVLARRSGSSPE
jgi:hypothetical protein